MRRLSVRLRRTPDVVLNVGTLAEQGRRIYFEFDAAFLERGLELSPFKFPARPGLLEHTDHAFGPLPGLFDDSLPDGWGLLLMDRRFRRRGVDPATLSPLDRLAYLGTRTMGALTYHPPAGDGTDQDDRLVDLHELGRNAEAVLEGDAAEVLPQLTRAGGPPGGARPKVLVGVGGAREGAGKTTGKTTGGTGGSAGMGATEVKGSDRIVSGEDDLPADFRPWMVKFAARADARDAGPIEYAYSLMARAAGIDMPRTRLFKVCAAVGAAVGTAARRGGTERRYFGVERFDRMGGNRRVHMHTFANLIHANFRIPSTDYVDLFKVTRALTRSHGDLLRLLRLMAFNIAAHNRDDHAKNFAFLLDDQTGEWSLAPAYDLIHSRGPGGEHTTTILGEGRRPDRGHCLKLAEQFDIGLREATPILEEVNAAVARWPEFAEQAECTRKAATAIAGDLGTI